MLPSCQRCRRRRIRCDINLPSCLPCLKANEECVFYDHVLAQSFPRK
jgi:hypothetical protein